MSEISNKVKWQMVIWALFMPVFLIAALVLYWPSAGSDDTVLTSKAQQEVRTAPIGQVTLASDVKPVAKTVEKVNPEEIYKTVCAACHATGLLGAPKKGDKAAWDERLKVAGGNFDGVVKIAIKGLNSMPAKGGTSLSDADFAQVVAYVSGLAPVEADAPKADAPKADAPKADAPKADAPKADAPKADAPKADAPKADAPKADAPKADAPKADAPKADAPKADAPKADAPKADEPAVAAKADNGFDPSATYNTVCKVCHSIGLANAPKKGDKAAWDERLKVAGSFDGIVKIAITGLNAMPPKGGANSLSDEDFAKVVAYMSDLGPESTAK